jgi:error-prone DNA polymerase
MSLLRPRLRAMRTIDSQQLKRTPSRQRVRIAGLVVIRQRPATAKGTLFFTLEDETGVINLIVRQRIYERYRRAARGSVVLLAEGRVERQGAVIHVLTERMGNLTEHLNPLQVASRDFR